MSALAAIRPMDNGTSADWMIAGQREVVPRASRRLTYQAKIAVGPHIANVAATAPKIPATE